VFVGIGVNLLHTAAAGLLMEAGWVLAMYGLVCTIFANRITKCKNTLHALTEELTEQIRQSVAAEPNRLPTRTPPRLRP
jgi:hypothetical protein